MTQEEFLSVVCKELWKNLDTLQPNESLELLLNHSRTELQLIKRSPTRSGGYRSILERYPMQEQDE